MKNLLKAFLIVNLGLLIAPNATAAWDAIYIGTISLVHLNSDVIGRGVCVLMNPALPQFGGWACLPTSNALYKEINSVLYMSYVTGKNCTLYVQFTGGDLYNEIKAAQCQ